jgi:hypothetical protein
MGFAERDCSPESAANRPQEKRAAQGMRKRSPRLKFLRLFRVAVRLAKNSSVLRKCFYGTRLYPKDQPQKHPQRKGAFEALKGVAVVSLPRPATVERAGDRGEVSPGVLCFGQSGAVRLDLPDRFDDLVHLLAPSQQQVLGQGDRARAHLAIALQLVETLAIRF